ncbi:MAG: pyruvate dehydrogenase (acetyl-transferring) E1 component subunit alpha, partial [Rickettsia endosymbiont of Ixodes ricinus]|nr:pyruvate dehydrogenase (acetyl-transferring) E1 component subunit alpha [Rickettsia endosymbiont of Ixodes ricinus]
DLKAIEQSVKEIVKEAVEFSENSPLPDEGELYTNIYHTVA